MFRRLLIFVFSFVVSFQAFAQALPVSNMQNAVSGMIQQRMAARGFAANDPRYIGTLQAVGSTVAGAAASAAVVTAAGVTAPAWVTAGVGIGLATLFAAGINLAIDGINWIFNSDGTVTVPGAVVEPYPDGPYVDGQSVTVRLDQFCNLVRSGPSTCRATVSIPATLGCFCAGADMSVFDKTINITSSLLNGSSSGAGKTVTPSDAVGTLIDTDLSKAANPSLVAAIADQAWKNAASKPGYDGLPYESANPLTATDAATWANANPANWPKVSDVVSPQAAPSGGTASSPFQLPVSSTPVATQPAEKPSTGTNPSTGEQVNLGSDPGIGSPGLEATPTASQILETLLNIFTDLSSFVVP